MHVHQNILRYDYGHKYEMPLILLYMEHFLLFSLIHLHLLFYLY
jgi:hypothetical protein